MTPGKCYAENVCYNYYVCNVTSSGSGGAKKSSQHQSTMHHRTNRSESLDRSHVGLMSGSDVSRHRQRVVGKDVPQPSHMSTNLADCRQHSATTESRLTDLKSM